MKYDIETSLGEIMKRGKALAIKRNKRAAALMGVMSGFIFCLMSAVFYNVSDFSGSGMISSNYGSFLLSRESGIYVFISVVFFVLGVVVSLGVIRFMEKKNKAKGGETQ